MKSATLSLALGAALLAGAAQAATNRPDGYSTICKSDESCSVSQATNVAFGAAGQFVYKVLNGSFICNIDTFGSDPIPSKTVKECSIPADGSGGGDDSAGPGGVNLTASAGNGQVSLSWSAASNASSYQVYRDTDSDPSGRTRIATLGAGSLGYTATGLSNGTPYWFWIKSTDSSGNSANSNAASATPSGSAVSLGGSAGDGQVSLSWSNPGTGSSYQIYQDTDANPSGRTRIATLAAGVQSYTATGLNNGTPYWFWVKYTDASGASANSNAFGATPVGSAAPVDPDATVVNSASALLSAIASASAGDTIYLRGGTYSFSDPIDLDQSGTAANPITLSKYPTDSARPVLNFSAMSESGSNRGIELRGSYWIIYGIDVEHAGDNGMHITGSYNTVEFASFSRNADTGLQLDSGASHNLIKNVDSYFNADASLENADGFAAKLGVGDGNRFVGCRAWNNLDDGYDGYLRGADNVTTTYENSWAIRNGYQENGSASGGDGNGFKTGGSDDKTLKHHAVFINTIAAGNAVDGFDHNSNRGNITIYNSVGYANGRNFGFGNTNAANSLTIKNSLSMDGGTSDSLNASSTNISHNGWQDGHSVNGSDFQSTDIDELLAPRKADGSLPDVQFFHLVNGSDLIDAGTNVGQPYSGSAPDIGAFEAQ